MQHHNQLGSPNSTYSGLDNLEFDRPPPPGPPGPTKRLQRIPRNNGHQQHHHQQHQHQQQQPTYNMTPAPQRQYYPPDRPQHPRQRLTHEFSLQQQPVTQDTGSYRASIYSDIGAPAERPPQRMQHGYTQNPGRPQHQPHMHNQRMPMSEQQHQQMRPRPPPPQYQQSQYQYQQNQQPNSGHFPYPSATVVGGGMQPMGRPPNMRPPGPRPPHATPPPYANQGAHPQQRERDFSNVVGHRRPTKSSMSSSGSSSDNRYAPMAMVPEQPFNGNSSMDFGTSS
ncbi:hypothetical protein FBU59_001131, partial [Linderina macrospora]